MKNSNNKKADQLGMPIGTASGKLRKSIIFNLIKKLNEHYCFQCGAEIESENELSIEHKTPYLDSKNPKELFFDLNNIAFSHLDCNIKAARKTRTLTHPSQESYKRGCRCNDCKEIQKLRRRDQRKRGIKT
ncbi:hypothetical protein [Leptolyngbya phage Lbo-JY46]